MEYLLILSRYLQRSRNLLLGARRWWLWKQRLPWSQHPRFLATYISLFFDESPPAGAVAAPSSWSVALAVEAATTVEPAPMISSTISLFFDAVHVATGSFYAKHTMDVVVHEHFIHRICPDCVLACTKPTLLSLID